MTYFVIGSGKDLEDFFTGFFECVGFEDFLADDFHVVVGADVWVGWLGLGDEKRSYQYQAYISTTV